MKFCIKCKQNKDFKFFSKDKSRKDGYNNKCKSCSKEYRENNKEKSKNYQSKYRIENSEYQINYRKNNKEKFANYQKERRASDPLFKLKGTLRNRIYTMFKFKDWEKNKHTEEILGANYNEVKQHIESTFQEGMSWGNHGEWHIDHKIPLDLADTEEELYELCHYTNLQALWAFDNLSKGNKT